jgi:Spx/MgsR family transcriptional regulator
MHTMPTILYGIKNCDTVRKARAWLDAHGISYRFHDLRSDGIDAATLNTWLQQVDTATLINTRGTTWRQLPENARQIGDNGTAVRLMLEHPTLIKRPVLLHDGKITVGFTTAHYANLFGL